MPIEVHSFPWLPPIQTLQRVKDRSSLAPEGGLVAAKRSSRQVGKLGSPGGTKS